ncbi:MAG: hypothetical protein GX640_10165, partial [Fibrobacter sp.]|nr:hypothetical protein [Fibrobacter sp.]
GWSIGGKPVPSYEMITTALPYFFLMCAGSISSTIPDLEGDNEEGKCTTAVFLGIKNAHLLATSLLFLSLIISILVSNYISAAISLICLPIYILFIFYKTALIMEATYKVGGAFCMFGAMVVFPHIIPMGLFVFLSTWLYFRIRHGVSYPSLVVVRNDS